MRMIGLDFETYAFTNLPQHGLFRYVRCPTFRPLIGAVNTHAADGSYWTEHFDFVIDGYNPTVRRLKTVIGDNLIVAHNAPFERAVLSTMGLTYPAERFIDSAVVARAAGAGSKLEAAAPQLLGVDKVEEGRNLMRIFSIPTKAAIEQGITEFDDEIVRRLPKEWDEYKSYCGVDAHLGLRIVEDWAYLLTSRENRFASITLDMNHVGWCVDLELVEEMQRRYLENQASALEEFRTKHNAADLNLNSLPQQKKWCADRGIKATSFDEKHVARYLKAIDKKLTIISPVKTGEIDNYMAVEDLLKTKQILGGSSLKKLATILDTAVEDIWNPGRHRLMDQYLHCGAGQTLRTTGRSVQMQNLKRLDSENIANVDELHNPDTEWDNAKMAENLRQGFTATDPYGFLIVGDFKSVESRGLAYLGGETWKSEAYARNEDLYEVLARKFYGIAKNVQVMKSQRQMGKVGELACGYGAGGQAVKDFAENMGTELTLVEATTLVDDWRTACPETINLWNRLNEMLHSVVEMHNGPNASEVYYLPDALILKISATPTPPTLLKQHNNARSIQMEVKTDGASGSQVMMRRVFHGCYVRGRDICYYKPTDLKSGDLWRQHYIHPKTKQLTFHKLYGGKLAGILTQSFCRELFFGALDNVKQWVDGTSQIELVGQFHDEIVLDWKPGAMSLLEAKQRLDLYMSSSDWAPSFPLAADIKHDYRYTK